MTMPDYQSGRYNALHARIGRYYSARILEHGATARGADWRDERSQNLRFAKLLEIHAGGGPFSIAEYGCGYGALYDYCAASGFACQYQGFDLSQDMIDAAQARFRGQPDALFFVGKEPRSAVDYCLASGIFNVCLDADRSEWDAMIRATLDNMYAWCRRGIAFNMLTSHADADKLRPDLYYADPGTVLHQCLDAFGRRVNVLHDYELYEFTVLVKKG